jgi:hypothetical protein
MAARTEDGWVDCAARAARTDGNPHGLHDNVPLVQNQPRQLPLARHAATAARFAAVSPSPLPVNCTVRPALDEYFENRHVVDRAGSGAQ